MVGMEKVEVLSKSYLVRWIHVNAGNTISWSLQPHKKSLNFGIFKHPGGGNTNPGLPTPPVIPAETSLEVPGAANDIKKTILGKTSSTDGKATVVEKLESLGMKTVSWEGKCEAEKVSVGKFDVTEGEGGMYGLVFDNTFSKQVSKTATFVLMTYPTNAPPTSGHHLHFSHSGATSSTTLSKPIASPGLGPAALSTDSLSHSLKSVAADPRPRSRHLIETKSFGGSTFYTGVVHKRKRKHNSYARRFFSLDFTTGTLSYYRNRHSSALRGAIPLSLAAVAMNDQRREISVDTGAEIWHLKVRNQKDFMGWRDALDRASSVARASSMSQISSENKEPTSALISSVEDEQEWHRVETLVGRISGIRDAVRRLAKDTDPKYLPSSGASNSRDRSPARSPSAASTEFPREDDQGDKRPFWKRKTSSNPGAGMFKRSFSASLMPTASPAIHTPNGRSVPTKHYFQTDPEEGMHDHCMQILKDLDQSVAEFTALLNESKERRRPKQIHRQSTRGSMSDDEFFDAQDSTQRSQLLEIRRDSQDVEDRDSFSDGASESSVEFDEVHTFKRRLTTDESTSLFPPKAKSLVPLPLESVQRRSDISAPKQSPPSLISFLRKNVGKDLSTIAMPVSANEPTSALQRVAEQLEYSELLDTATNSDDPNTRLLNVAAFAISSFSSARIKERAVRKPFNPMLGETFELVREDKGYRLITEKISHRPVQMAIQAQSKDWTFLQSPAPVQKFWGKSAELNTEGRARVFLHSHSEIYSYTLATSFLRNVIAGEKYIEPVSTMTIINESTGAKAVVNFKAGGLFSGRSEEVSIQAFDEKGDLAPNGAVGKWTSHLHITSNGQDAGASPLWTVGKLVEDANKRYGFTTFAAQLNQITSVEDGKLPPTDSRLRPDQRAAEDGLMDEAEAVKAKLEERQRGRRRVLEEHGEDWKPKWFFKAGSDGDEEVWRLKTGKDGYWEAREKGEWTGVVDVFET